MISTEELVKKFNLEPQVVCYIGANEGQELPDMIKYFPNSTIHCFEPQKKTFEKLKNNFKGEKNIIFYNFALGNENKTIDIYTNINNNNMSSSILEPKDHLYFHKEVIFDGLEEIELKKFNTLRIDNVDYLNIDVQGFELEVLKGFDNLDEIKYIKTEVNRKELYKNCVLINELDKFLKKFNFIRVKTVWWQLTVPWGDAFYIKKDLISTTTFLKCELLNRIQNIKGYFWFVTILIKLGFVKIY